MDIHRDAPATASHEALVEAPVETVWAVLTHFNDWPRWNEAVTRIRVLGPLAAGTRFAWVAGGLRINSRIEEVSPPFRIVWTGTTLGIRAIHVWDLEPRSDRTLVRTEESFSGLLPRLFPRMLQKQLRAALAQGVTALKRAAEQHGHPT